ncbi:MAG: ATP-binding cassette domain-containing protein [Candidatus Methylacidiphilales bacterium]
MLTLTDVSKAFGGRELFTGVSLQLNRGDRIGLVGANGAGKSTLFSIILGNQSPDEGSVTRERAMSLGFLPQETAPKGDETVLETATELTAKVGEMRRLVAAHEQGREVDDAEYHHALAHLNDSGAFAAEPKAKAILRGLAFREEDFDKPLKALSGGWCMRAHLARLLVMEPDLLMLDEPTNHLDLESVIWFQNYLQAYPGAILTISHDREFLNALVDQIIELRHRRMQRYIGDFDHYLIEREERHRKHVSAYENQQRQIELMQRSAEKFRASARRSSQAQNKLRQIDRMEMIETPQDDEPVLRFRFPQPARVGQHPIRLQQIHQAYGDHVVYQGIDFECTRGQRLVLVGPNGAGKSTLLKILGGIVPFQKGERVLGHNVNIGYYAQNRTDMLKPSRTVLQEALAMEKPFPEQDTRTLLGCFLFRGDDVFKPVSVLSGGEKSRLALVKQLINPPNVLLMDEPTTHLDIPSIEALIYALKQYEGTLIVISHDVYFIRSIAENVLHIAGGKLTFYPGTYDYYLEKTKSTARAGLTAPDTGSPALSNQQPQAMLEMKERTASTDATQRKGPKSKEQKRREAEERQALARQRKEQGETLEDVESRIAQLESRQEELTTLLQNPGMLAESGKLEAAQKELATVAKSLETAYSIWEKMTRTLQSI